MSKENSKRIRVAPRGSQVQPLGSIRVETISVESATDLLQMLSPLSSTIRGDYLVYRGHGDANWGLEPSGWRANYAPIDELLDGRTPGTYGAQVYSEAHTLLDFIESVDAQGIAIPGDYNSIWTSCHQYVNPSPESIPENFIQSWPPPSVIPALALAQHFGVPTRLLDWSLDPFVAAYFAASHFLTDPTATEFAIWIYDYPYSLIIPHPKIEEQPIHLAKPSYASNENLRSQSGVLLVVRLSLGPDAPFSKKPMESYLTEDYDSRNESGPALFTKLTLNSSEAPLLLYNLRLLGYSAKSMFPGLTGSARETNEERLIKFRTASMEDWPTRFDSDWQRRSRQTSALSSKYLKRRFWFGPTHIEHAISVQDIDQTLESL